MRRSQTAGSSSFSSSGREQRGVADARRARARDGRRLSSASARISASAASRSARPKFSRPAWINSRLSPGALPEHRAVGGKGGGLAGLGRGEIGQRDRNGEFRPQAIFAAAVGGQQQAPAHVLARKRQEHRGRLQHGGVAGLDSPRRRALQESLAPLIPTGAHHWLQTRKIQRRTSKTRLARIPFRPEG